MRTQRFEHPFADAQTEICRSMKLEKAPLQLLAYWSMNPGNVGPPVVKSHNQWQSVPSRITLRDPAAAAICECQDNCPRPSRRCGKALLQWQCGVHEVIDVNCPSSRRRSHEPRDNLRVKRAVDNVVMFSGQDVQLNAPPVDHMSMQCHCSSRTLFRPN